MKSDKELERALKTLARREVQQGARKSRIKHVVAKAREHAALRQGLGFLTALFWVFIAGFGLKLWSQTKHNSGNMSLYPNAAYKNGDKS